MEGGIREVLGGEIVGRAGLCGCQRSDSMWTGYGKVGHNGCKALKRVKHVLLPSFTVRSSPGPRES